MRFNTKLKIGVASFAVAIAVGAFSITKTIAQDVDGVAGAPSPDTSSAKNDVSPVKVDLSGGEGKSSKSKKEPKADKEAAPKKVSKPETHVYERNNPDDADLEDSKPSSSSSSSADKEIRQKIRKNAEEVVRKNMNPRPAVSNDTERAINNRPKANKPSINIIPSFPIAPKAQQGPVSILPRMVPPDIPIIPIDLLFPKSTQTVTKEAEVNNEIAGSYIIMFGVNRMTGQSLEFKIPVGTAVNYERLTIKATACYKSAPNEPDESWGYVDVIDNGEPYRPQLAILPQRNSAQVRAAQGAKIIKHGWIMASSPDVTPIDHPLYDLKLVSCSGGAAGERAPIIASNPAPEEDKKDQPAKVQNNKAAPQKKHAENKKG